MDRWVPFEAVFNFRDLGGYPTVDGRTVRTGRLYRSGGLARLTDAELPRLGTLTLRSVIDLRRPDEVADSGRFAQVDGIVYHHVCLQRARWSLADVPPEGMSRYLADRYADIAEEGVAGPIGVVLRLLADAAMTPAVFHCAAGKDRTGVVAALVLALLGVPDETIVADYALSQRAEDQYLAWRRTLEPEFGAEFLPNAAPAEAMRLFLIELRERYGSVETYAEQAGVDRAHRAALAAHLLV